MILKCDERLSNFAFKFNLRRYTGGECYPEGAQIPEPADHHMITRKPAHGVWFRVTARRDTDPGLA